MKAIESIDPRSARDIDIRIEKIIRGLGNPEPPLNLIDARELLRLDTRFYSSSDTGIFAEYVSKVRIGARQLALRPALIWDVIRKADLKALCLPDQKRILIDSSLPVIKHRWVEAHEITHVITPWHEEFLFGDDDETLRHECHEKLEREANYGAGRLLFLQKRFINEAYDRPRTLETIRSMAKGFGNTITSTLWRFVEEAPLNELVFGVVSLHPHHLPAGQKEQDSCRYLIGSSAFRNQFRTFSERDAFGLIRSYCKGTKKGPLGDGEVNLRDVNGQSHKFRMESFSNGYEVLTLGIYRGLVPVIVASSGSR